MWGKEKEFPYFEHITEFPNPEDQALIKGAVDLVNYFNKSGLMLPVTQEHYTMLAKKGTLAIEKNSLGSVIGTAAFTQFYEGGIWEFGGWAVAEEFQHQGIASRLINILFWEVTHVNTIAFGNKNSGPILEKMGAVVIEDHSKLPEKAFELCSTCPKKPLVGCCDVIYSLKPIIQAIHKKKMDEAACNIGCNR